MYDNREREAMFEGKARYAERKNATNSDILAEHGVDENIRDIIKDIAGLRHEMHACQWDRPQELRDALKNLYEDFEELKGTKFYLDFGTFSQDCEWDAPRNVFDWDDITCDVCAMCELLGVEYNIEESKEDDDYDSAKSDECWQLVVERNSDIKDEANKVIERWMERIDEEYGTNICPTGYSRLF